MMILTAPKLLTLQAYKAPLEDGAVVIQKDKLLALGRADAIIAKYPDQRVCRIANAVLAPGLVNVHAHLELPSFFDKARSSTYTDWILDLINAKKGLTSLDYRSAVQRNIRDVIASGTTTVAEISTHEASPELLARSGLRGVVFHEIIAMNRASFAARLSALTARRRLKPAATLLLKNGLSPHAPHTVSAEVLNEIMVLALQCHLPLCMHVAESKDEIRLLQRKKSGLEKLYKLAGWDINQAPRADSAFAYLHGLGLLSKQFLAVHAVQVTDKDIALVKKSKTSVAHCPRSNKELGVGRMPLKKFLDSGITVGLGTDSLASSPSLNMWDEMRYAYRIHRKDGVTAQDIFRLATINGAKALGLDNEIGTLVRGKKADIIAVPLPKKNTGDLYSDLLRETKSCIMSIVNGKIIYSP
jgi:cytosine/adenosine deaminase-related metal-dependent hydrolase